MVRVPCCEKLGVKKGPWTPEEDQKLVTFIQNHGHTSWRALPKQAGLSRCGKSCRLRWTNYLRPGIKRGNFTAQEENSIIQLHAVLGNRWSTISTHLPGRTDNEIKNHWNTRLRKRMLKMGLDPATHRPWALPHPHVQPPPTPSQINTLLLSLLQGAPSALVDPAQSPLLSALLLGSHSLPNNSGLFPTAPGHVLQSNAPAGPLPPSASSALPAPAMLDPALLAAAETRLVLDCLKFNNAGNQAASTSDHHLNQLLTRLLLLKLLQGSTNSHNTPTAPCNAAAAPNCYDDRAPVHSNTQHATGPRMSGPVSADLSPQNQGLHHSAVSGLMLAANNRESSTAGPAPPLAFANPLYGGSLTENNHTSSTPSTTLLNMFGSSSYQQRLLQTLPFLAESVIEPSASAASTDHLSSTSSHQLSQRSFPNSTAELPTSNASLPNQQTTAPWQGGSIQPLTQLAQLSAGAGLMQKHSLAGEINQMLGSDGQLLGAPGGMHDVAVSKAPTLMTWEEHLMMSEPKGGGERDLASSSTVSSSTLSSGGSQSQGQQPTPNTPTNNFNIQEYWSNLLNLISSSK